MRFRHALLVSYHGAAFHGWQSQANARSVQDTLERALGEALGLEGRLVGASRTDAGVHARGQVAHLDAERALDLGALSLGVNRHLPEDVRVLAAAGVPPDFHARFSALAKRYVYRLVRAEVLSPLDAPFAARAPRGLTRDVAALAAIAALFEGEHDFTAFALAGGSHRHPRRRVTRAAVEEDERGLRFVVEGDGFLRGMVRGMVGTWLDVGRGHRPASDIARLLGGAPRSEAGPTAPARGLCLERVEYGRVLAFEGLP